MHVGVYALSMLSMIFDEEPEQCLRCDTKVFNDGVHDRCDTDATIQFRFPNGGIGEVCSSLRGSMFWKLSEARVMMKEVVVSDPTLPSTQEKVKSRQVTMFGFMHAVVWHRIDVKDSYTIRNKADGAPVKTWVESTYHKAYSYKEAGGKLPDFPGEDWWMSYRYLMEEFVNRVKQRQTNQWYSGADSIRQMRMIDMAYERSGLGLRPTSSFR